MRRVRYAETGFEMRCDACLDWWPIDLEFWYPRRGLSRCLACSRAGRREVIQKFRASPERRAAERAAHRAYWRANAPEINARRREKARAA